MTDERSKLRAISLTVLVVLSVFAGSIAFSGAAAAATNTSITPDDDDANAADVTYTADGNVELGNQDTLQHVDVHLSPADVSNVGESDVSVYIDGNEYQDSFSQFSTSGGTVEVKLANSRSVSDGDRVRVVVADVTNPSDDFSASMTLHDTSDAQWQEYTDTVSIDTQPDIKYDNLQFDDSRRSGSSTTVNVGEALDVSATITNDGEQTGSYDASLKVDGTDLRDNQGQIAGESSKQTSFTTSFGSVGSYDVTIENLGATEVTVTDPLAITGGSATPEQVTPETTVNDQKVYVNVDGVSQDGDTDWHYVEFPNALTNGLSVNSVDANATSITSSPNLVDGYDNDGTTETVKFATSGDGGGDIALNLTVDASVQYPDTETTYGVDARTVDSGGETDTQEDVATIEAVVDDSTDDSDGSNHGGGGTEYTLPTPSVTDFYLTADGQEVDVVVKTDHPTTELQVDVSGAASINLSRPSFDAVAKDGDDVYTSAPLLALESNPEDAKDRIYVHTAEVSTGDYGTFRATVDGVAQGSSEGVAGQADTITVPLPADINPGAAASPTWVGTSDSTHIFRSPVTANASLTGETLSSLTVQYSDRFHDASGSITSVSDDQNVATLLVQDANGTVRSRMGGTDAVSVNVENGAVQLDLSDVDSSRKPTLEAGDRVVVRLRPVTNPADAGEYETQVSLETRAGNSTSLPAPLQIRTRANVEAVDTAYVGPSENQTTLELNGSDAVESASVTSQADAAGAVRVVMPDDAPSATDEHTRPVVTTMKISRPDAAQDTTATITARLETDDFQANASEFTLAHYSDASGNWTQLETHVVDRSDGTVTIEATTPGASTFDILSATTDSEQHSQRQTESRPDDEPSATETTSGSGPGFGFGLAALALVGVSLLLFRRRN